MVAELSGGDGDGAVSVGCEGEDMLGFEDYKTEV